ncbi:MAG: PEP/pyruvate-binding domain-containing protein [bacterium]
MADRPDPRNEGEGAASGGADPRTDQDWRTILEEMRSDRPRQYLRISRRMLNHLCSIGLTGAQKLLGEIDRGAATQTDEDRDRSNVPGARVAIEETPLMTGAPFALAEEYLGDDEILSRLQKWLYEDKASFFCTVVGDSRSTMPQIVDAIRLYNGILRGRSGLAMSTLKSLRVSLIQRFLTEQIDYINVAKEVVRITDFIDLVDHITMTEGCHGKLGGKAAGLLMARWILEQPEAQAKGIGKVRIPRTWYVISDAIMDFVKLNNLDDVMDQKFKDITQVRREYPNIIQLFKNSNFPVEVITGLSRALDYFGEVPLIIRSSSLLEDRFGTTFSGKYKSLFLANQGTKQQRLEALLDAVAEVWASVLGPDPIEYRRERGLQEFVEEMGILIQEVVGTRVGPWWLPAFAGVAFSRNEFRWSPRIAREDGLIRLVPGLGTRAVDRVGDDFPVLAVPGQPALRANPTPEERVRYSPVWADVINLETNRFETVRLKDLLHEAGADFPLVEKIFSVLHDGRLQRVSRLMMDPAHDDLVADMEGLIGGTPFVGCIGKMLKTLEEYLGSPVDIEFAHDGECFHLLQCRPQAQSGDAAPAEIPRGLPAADIVFTARRFVSNGWVPDISHVVYVDPERYAGLATVEDMRRVGRAVGRLNSLLPKRRFILMGPGRWGSRGDIKLGVAVTYADINNTAVLIEIARRRGDYTPDLSFGTHFFQDLVEASIRYLPLYPDDEGVTFNEDFLVGADNLLPRMLPEFADLAAVLRVIEVGAVRPGRILRLLMNADTDEAVAVLAEPGQDQDQQSGTGPGARSRAGTLREPRQYWRWRLRMTERMIRALDHRRLGVAAVYIYGSVKNGTARPDSDIDLLVHFQGDGDQRRMLEMWFAGWSQALAEMNFSRTGVRVDPMLDVTLLSDAEIAAGEGVAGRIGAVTNAARRLPFGDED